MKKLKIFLWVILIGILGLIMFQNKEYLLEQQSMTFNFYVSEEYQSPPLPNGVWFLACIVIGFLVSYFFNLVDRFKANRTQKELQAKIDSQIDMISKLRSQLETIETPLSETSPIEPVEDTSSTPDPQIPNQPSTT